MKKSDYCRDYREVADILKGGMKDALKLNKLEDQTFYAYKEYHKFNDKRIKLFEEKKYYQAAKLQNKCLKLLIKAQTLDNKKNQAQIDLADMKKIYAKTKKDEAEAKAKKKKSKKSKK